MFPQYALVFQVATLTDMNIAKMAKHQENQNVLSWVCTTFRLDCISIFLYKDCSGVPGNPGAGAGNADSCVTPLA